jgi:putative multiple sugar transport system substrate-binding protein
MRSRLALALVVAVAGLSGCTGEPAAPAVAIALPDDGGRWEDVAEILTESLTGAGYRVQLRTAGGDIPTQVRQVGELLDAAPSALIVAPLDASSLTPVLDAASPGTEVVSFATLVRDTGAVDGFVGFDAAVEGYLQAQDVVHGLGLDAGAAGPFRIELFAGSVDDERAEPAYAAAMSVLQPYLTSGVLVVGSGETTLDQVTTLRGNAATAASRLTRILHETYAAGFPDAVLAPSDSIARGVAGVLLDAGAVAGEGFPVVTGRGAELRSIVALLDGRQYSTVLEDPRLLAVEAANRVIDALGATGVPPATDAPGASGVDNGARLVPASLVQPVSVRVGDIDGAVVGTGYWTRARIDDAVREFGAEPATPAATPPPG